MLTKTRSSRGDKTRQALLTAGRERFQEQGFDKATTGDIARRAGVAEGTLFLHFKSKTGLLLQIMETYYAGLIDDLRDEAGRSGAGGDKLRALTRYWLQRVRQDWRLMRVFGRHGRFSDDPAVASAFVDMNRQVTRFFGAIFKDLKASGVIRADLPTYLLRDILFGCTEHVLLGIHITGKERDLDRAADALCDLLLAPPTRSTAAVSLESLDAKLDRLLQAADLPTSQTPTNEAEP